MTQKKHGERRRGFGHDHFAVAAGSPQAVGAFAFFILSRSGERLQR
jgi:hypothetical protein